MANQPPLAVSGNSSESGVGVAVCVGVVSGVVAEVGVGTAAPVVGVTAGVTVGTADSVGCGPVGDGAIFIVGVGVGTSGRGVGVGVGVVKGVGVGAGVGVVVSRRWLIRIRPKIRPTSKPNTIRMMLKWRTSKFFKEFINYY
jgi:hypothetical protein